MKKNLKWSWLTKIKLLESLGLCKKESKKILDIAASNIQYSYESSLGEVLVNDGLVTINGISVRLFSSINKQFIIAYAE